VNKSKKVRYKEMIDLSSALSPKQVAEKLTQACGSVVAERAVRERARKIGACRIIGKAMMILPDDLEAILEDMRPCPSGSTSGERFGTMSARSTGDDYAALVKFREKQEKERLAKKRK
jgi:hypothetical protein